MILEFEHALNTENKTRESVTNLPLRASGTYIHYFHNYTSRFCSPPVFLCLSIS